ncbi:MAG: phenylacetate-CoA oxygenase subunit PaaC [Balneola sp.]|nr:phenylacetate-CoA oxygenase subunit PaaC [Balneola sp.]MBO6649618.1 phenylacetate-CoA oxygenase subunit PaaC [Balneola sp.]MBO6711435.1 phenylacetate-CoA oxygenase subunit PaaC [Balneola sp.]MBO6801211.1 phenylacetate-CoA oxygenase subunit PaaC [Balneola sp.]MBO6869371.1 phenylacetate-CoA oxygenase subunit PaaC [Balneola sp.]
MNTTKELSVKESKIAYLLRLADDRLILGQRMSEWCGHGPVLEEDLALANMALDLIGHASSLYAYAAEVEDEGRDEDHFAYFRDDYEFTNLQLYELPKGDFAFTIARQFLFSSFSYFQYQQLKEAKDEQFAGMIDKHFKEIKYHLRHSRDWVLKLGDGTEESKKRMQEAFDELWMYTGELFYIDAVDEMMLAEGNGADLLSFKDEWKKLVEDTLTEATLSVPDWDQFMMRGSRTGMHTEHLGHMLAQMQFLRRSHPDADWK